MIELSSATVPGSPRQESRDAHGRVWGVPNAGGRGQCLDCPKQAGNGWSPTLGSVNYHGKFMETHCYYNDIIIYYTLFILIFMETHDESILNRCCWRYPQAASTGMAPEIAQALLPSTRCADCQLRLAVQHG